MQKLPPYLALIFAFLLGSHNGFLALWKESDPEPVRVFPYKVSSLPLADQKMLEKGIRIETGKELTQMLEDYLS
jgi:hypothetical protein